MSIGGYNRVRHEINAPTSTIPYYGIGGLYRVNIYEIKVEQLI